MISRLVADRRIVAVVVVLWAAVTWGTRIGLLTDAEAADPLTWLRVGGSLATAFAAAVVLGFGVPAAWVVGVYGLWAVGVWGTSLMSVWTDPHPLGFRLVHTLLAVASWLVAWAAWRAVRRSRRPVQEPVAGG